MATLRERNRERTRAEIAEVALSLFEEQGYEGTTVEQIATASGVSSATFFRYFATKEDVLFRDEDDAAARLVEGVRRRTDQSPSVAALVEPVVEYAGSLADGSVPRLARLVMTTRTLEARSLRMRLRWEHDLAHELAVQRGAARPELADTAIAAVAVSCLTSGLRHWDHRSPNLSALVRDAFRSCGIAP